jgi:citrate lyase alpha subunit
MAVDGIVHDVTPSNLVDIVVTEIGMLPCTSGRTTLVQHLDRGIFTLMLCSPRGVASQGRARIVTILIQN